MADAGQLERRVQRLEHLLRVYRLGLGLAVTAVLLLAALAFMGRSPRSGRAILVNDRIVAMVKNEKTAAAVRQRLLREGRGQYGGAATFHEKWEDETRPVEGARVLSLGEAVRVLESKVTVVVEAWAVEANGTQLLVTPSKDVAESVLSKLKSRYASQSDAVVRSTRLQPEPALRPVTVPPSEIVTDIMEGVRRLSEVRAKPEQHQVQAGEYPERIAAQHHMKLADLYRLNPGMRGSDLRVGQTLQVLGPGAGLVVVTVKETASTEAIAPPVQRVATRTLPKGVQKVGFAGLPGRRRVRYEVVMHNEQEVSRRVVSEENVSLPRPKQVLVGTG
jgi:LysM repeat protein